MGLTLLLVLVLAFVVQTCLDGVGRALLLRNGEATILEIRKRLLARVLRLPMRSYERNRLGGLLTRATADTVLLRDSVAFDLGQLAASAVLTIGGTATMVAFDPLLAASVWLTMLVASPEHRGCSAS